MVSQTRNRFGLDTHRQALPQFLRILDIEYGSAAGNEIKRNIAKISESHFSLNKPPAAQVQALMKIESELIEKYPELYGGPPEISQKRLYFALHVARDHHNRRRYRRKQTEHQRKSRQQASVPYETKKKVAHRRTTQQVALPSAELAAGQKPAQTSVVAFIDLTSMDDSDVDSREGSPELGCQPASDIKAGIQPKAFKNIKTENGDSVGKQDRFIRKFLNSCDPPMGKYLEAFRDVPEGYLRPLAKWGSMSKRRKDLIKEIVQKAGKPVSDLDVAFLDNHVCAYFGEGLEERSSL